MVTIEERFQAAVNVIKNLPKNGPYQPTPTMMLKFYGLFKQATEGSCEQRKPSFWDIIGKAKWDAWHKNHHLTKEEAMQQYVDGLHEIIETMSFTENVQNFVGKLSGFDNINLDELEMVYPGMREIAESHPNSPFNSKTNSPQHNKTNGDIQMSNGDSTNTMNDALLDECEDEHPPTIAKEPNIPSGDKTKLQEQQKGSEHNQLSTNYNISNNTYIDQSDDEYSDPFDSNHEFTEALGRNSKLLVHVQTVVKRMNEDLAIVNERMIAVEKSVQDLCSVVQKTKIINDFVSRRQYPKWWPFQDISPVWFAFLVLWPFLANRLTNMLTNPKRK